MSWVSFAVIGWQSSAFTSWNWSWGGSEEILQHVGFHVMGHVLLNVPHWVEMGQKRGYNVVLFQSRSPRYPSALATAESKNLEVSSLEGNKEKPWQINHSQAGIPLPQLTDISFYGRFANKVWSQRQAWDPLGNACGITKEEQEASVRVCVHTNAACSQLEQYLTSYFEHL